MKFFILLFVFLIVILAVFGVIVGVTLLVNLGASTDNEDDDNANRSWDSSSLPYWAEPSAYTISLSPNLETFELLGNVKITFKV